MHLDAARPAVAARCSRHDRTLSRSHAPLRMTLDAPTSSAPLLFGTTLRRTSKAPHASEDPATAPCTGCGKSVGAGWIVARTCVSGRRFGGRG
jgi:hypothetical protein